MAKFFFVLLLILFIQPQRVYAQIALQDERGFVGYWTNRLDVSGDDIIMYGDEIDAFNQSLRLEDVWLTNLADYPLQVSGEFVRSKIIAADKRGNFSNGEYAYLFANGQPLKKWQYDRVLDKCNLAAIIDGNITVNYAVAKRRSNLRLLPESVGWFESATDTHYDSLQATIIDPLEPTAVLAYDADGEFAFVQTADYSGWLPVKDLYFMKREEWEKFAAPQNFLVVTANKLALPIGDETVLFQMGAKIPFIDEQSDGYNWRVLLPDQNSPALVIPKDTAELRAGFLPLTERNILEQAFKFLGDEYGWGGLDNSVDCSSFVMAVYKSMGVRLPRDADWQSYALKAKNNVGGSRATRMAAVRNAPLGSLLFKPGHVMMYLGTDDNGEPLVIHSASSYCDFSGGNGRKIYVRQVLVSDLHYKNGSGTETIDGLTGIGVVRAEN